jgi:DNA-binding transcriptional MocR family regulator
MRHVMRAREDARDSRVKGTADPDAFLYERIADELDGMVARGALRAGDRLPSVRRLSEERGVSVATVLAAYLLLEGRGVAEARPKSGHFVRTRRTDDPPVPSMPRRAPSPARVSIAAGADDLIRAMIQDRGLVPLGTAYVAAELLPLRKLNAALAAVAREGGGLGGAYDELRGNLQLRRQLARRAVAWGAFLEADDFVTTAGATEAMNLSLQAVTKPGDVIAVESPAYFGLLRLVDARGLRAIEIPSDARTGLDLDALDDAVRAGPVRAVLVTPNFSNPLGARMPDEHKERLVRMLARRDIPLVEDDVYGDLAFDGTRPRPAKSFDTAGNVLLCGSVSKTLAPGYRVGWVAPGKYRDAVEKLKFAHSVSSPTPTQMAVAELLAEGGYDRHVRQLRRVLAAQSAQYREAIARSFPEGTRVSRPQGGFVVWVELAEARGARSAERAEHLGGGGRGEESGSTRVDAVDLQLRALDKGIAIAPGTIFSARQRFGNCIRISTGHPWSPQIERAIATLGELARG